METPVGKAVLGMSVRDVAPSTEMGTTTAVGRVGGEGGRGVKVGVVGHEPEGAGGPDKDRRGDWVPFGVDSMPVGQRG